MKKNILCLSGSSRLDSSNSNLLQHLSKLNDHLNFEVSRLHFDLPLFTADKSKDIISVKKWKEQIEKADGIIICTPEYIYNMPAVLKNGLEWLTESGSCYQKPIIPICYTPNAPRGEKAMKSLLWTLQALEMNILTEVQTYKTTIWIDKQGVFQGEDVPLLTEALKLF